MARKQVKESKGNEQEVKKQKVDGSEAKRARAPALESKPIKQAKNDASEKNIEVKKQAKPKAQEGTKVASGSSEEVKQAPKAVIKDDKTENPIKITKQVAPEHKDAMVKNSTKKNEAPKKRDEKKPVKAKKPQTAKEEAPERKNEKAKTAATPKKPEVANEEAPKRKDDDDEPTPKGQKREAKEIDLDELEDEDKAPLDDDEIDETYSDLDDDQLLELALKDDEEEGGKRERKGTGHKHKKLTNRKNVLYLGHVPHGFFEQEIKAFLSQFGKILKVRVSRSKKSGKSRGYAFVQVENPEVAEIIKKTMHGYILMGRSLVCQSVPEEHVHDRMFMGGLVGKNSKVETFPDARKKRVLAHGHIKDTPEAEARRSGRLIKSDEKRKARLAKKGIAYAFTGHVAQKPKAA